MHLNKQLRQVYSIGPVKFLAVSDDIRKREQIVIQGACEGNERNCSKCTRHMKDIN